VILALEPFTEWLIHVFILHFRPKAIAGRLIDPLVSRKHRAHHQDPRDLGLVLVPLRVLRDRAADCGRHRARVSHAATPARSPALATGYALLLTYEWTHFLLHSKYPPAPRLLPA